MKEKKETALKFAKQQNLFPWTRVKIIYTAFALEYNYPLFINFFMCE